MDNIKRENKYSRGIILVLSVLIAMILFYYGRNFAPFHDFLISLGYFGTFFGGFFYAYGFTATPAAAVLLMLAKGQNLILSGLIGGFGALVSDILIFFFIRHSFMGHIKKVKDTKIITFFRETGKKIFGIYLNPVLFAFAGFLIATPFPTEIGVAIIASIKKISLKRFSIIAYLLHTLGIFIILALGHVI